MELFSTSYLPSFPNTQFTVPPTYLTNPSNEHGHGHNNFIRFLQHAQGLEVNILPLVWEPAFEVLGEDGATGRVNENQLNAQFAFAFKRFKPDKTDPSISEAQFRDLQYSALINEMTILCCPPIKDHGNVIIFIGVGFELFSATGEVWPMLIFSKFNQGDLGTFMYHSQNLEEDILLGICGEVAKAVQVLHDCIIIDVAHGDIKPGNILMAQDIEQDVISVGLADFGFSAFSKSDEGLVYVTRSEPWEAPEWHPREFSMMNAKKMDVYSFGLLCLWMFFRKESLTDLGFPLANIDMAVSRTNQDITAAIQALKQNGDAMLFWALQLLQKNTALTDQNRSCLEQIFRLTLVHNSSERNTNMEVLVRLISATEDQNDLPRTDPATVSVAEWHGSLSIEKLFFHLESCDYRIHSFIAKSLTQTVETGNCECCCQNAAFQLSLCNSLGFGVIQNEQECTEWLSRSGKMSSDLADTRTRIKEAEPEAGFLSRLAQLGYRTDLPSRYRQDGILSLAIEKYDSMILARQSSLGPSHFSTLRLKGMLMKLLRWNNQHSQALDLALETIEKEKLRPVDALELKSTISLIYHELGDNTEAESIEREILDTYGGEQWRGDTSRLDNQTNLVDILTTRGQYEGAKELGQKTVQECITELGIHHASTRAAKRSLAAAYNMSGELTEALRITEELVQSEEQYSKLEQVNPKLVEDVSRLGIIYYRLGRYDSALSCYERVQEWIKRNAVNAIYAIISVNNQATKLIQQGAMSEAKSILEALLTKCTDVLGLKSEETALVIGNLEVIYHSEQAWDKAEQLGKQVIEMRREILGPSHHKTLTALGNHRALFLAQKKHMEAFEIAKEEIASVKNAADTTPEAVVKAIITISGAFESAGAFHEAISILEESSLNGTDGGGPQQGLRVIVQEAVCYLHLGQLEKAREALSTLFSCFQIPFKEDLNILIPELLRLTKMFLLHDCMVEAKQVLNAASIFTQKSMNVTDDVKDEVKAMALEYHNWKGFNANQPSLGQPVMLSLSTEEQEEMDGSKSLNEANTS